VKLLLQVYDWLQKNLRPPSAFSWETLILLSLFSFYMSVLATDFVHNLLENFAWIFLILGVYWGTTSANQLRIGYKYPTDPGFPLSPWITGAIVSFYLYSLNGIDAQDALVSWPIISAIIAAIPDFLTDDLRLKTPPPYKRQNLVILFGTQMLLSCWFQFYFVIQDWIAQYPTLLADDFHQSAFVVKREVDERVIPRGASILNSMEPKLAQQLNNKPWPQVERSLLPQQRTKLISAIAQQAKQQSDSVVEDDLWRVTSGVSSRNSGYNLLLQATWQGPRSGLQQKYSITKSCQITQVLPNKNSAIDPTDAQPGQQPAPVSGFQCQPVKGWGIDEPRRNSGDSFIRI
jgi:hypothetical protein